MDIQQLKKDTPIFFTKLPKEILKEIDKWIIDCKKIKNHKLSYLKEHDNVGTNYNDYQVNVPKRHIENGFFLAYLLRFCSKAFGGHHRDYMLQEHHGHFDGYDIWANFAYENNSNPVHDHSGNFSGVYYHKNKDLTQTIFVNENREYEGEYAGDEGTMVIFPSDTLHKVNLQKSKKERITIAFNILKR